MPEYSIAGNADEDAAAVDRTAYLLKEVCAKDAYFVSKNIRSTVMTEAAIDERIEELKEIVTNLKAIKVLLKM